MTEHTSTCQCHRCLETVVAQPVRADLADQLVHAILANRAQINASRIAHGECGRVEIHVNPHFPNTTRVAVLVEDRYVA